LQSADGAAEGGSSSSSKAEKCCDGAAASGGPAKADKQQCTASSMLRCTVDLGHGTRARIHLSRTQEGFDEKERDAGNDSNIVFESIMQPEDADSILATLPVLSVPIGASNLPVVLRCIGSLLTSSADLARTFIGGGGLGQIRKMLTMWPASARSKDVWQACSRIAAALAGGYEPAYESDASKPSMVAVGPGSAPPFGAAVAREAIQSMLFDFGIWLRGDAETSY